MGCSAGFEPATSRVTFGRANRCATSTTRAPWSEAGRGGHLKLQGAMREGAESQSRRNGRDESARPSPRVVTEDRGESPCDGTCDRSFCVPLPSRLLPLGRTCAGGATRRVMSGWTLCGRHQARCGRIRWPAPRTARRIRRALCSGTRRAARRAFGAWTNPAEVSVYGRTLPTPAPRHLQVYAPADVLPVREVSQYHSDAVTTDAGAA